MIQAKAELTQALADTLAVLAPGSGVVAAFESPKQAAHGDLAITAAMALARPLKAAPRALAERLSAALVATPAFARWVEGVEIAGPGFINLRLAAAAKQAVVAEVRVAGERFGWQPASGHKVMIEFVSANPTGPLHVGHARQAALGDSLAHLLQTQGHAVLREFYYNDAGVQIATLADSVQARLRGLVPGAAGWPEAAYNGEYIADIAAAFRAGASVQAGDRAVAASGNADDQAAVRDFAVAYLRREQDLDLQAFGVRFDSYFLESSLYARGAVEATVAALVASGTTYEQDGALWLRSTDYGDDKDRVMRKSDGSYTYFVPDVAYHLNKYARGYHQAINCQGTDHHGTIARVRAGLQAANPAIAPGFPQYVLNTMVRVVQGGQEVKVSKRAGGYVTLRDLVDWTSRDAVRFFLISRKADTEFTFDVDLALQQNDENPVFYVQYAHARICSVLAQGASKGVAPDGSAAALERLVAPSELALMAKLGDYPDLLTRAAASLAPHDVAFYLRDLAAAFHSYYAAERFLVDDTALAGARLALLDAARTVLAAGLALLGVSAPQVLARETQQSTDTPAQETA